MKKFQQASIGELDLYVDVCQSTTKMVTKYDTWILKAPSPTTIDVTRCCAFNTILSSTRYL